VKKKIKPSCAVVGCGKVGTVIGRELQNAGYRLVGLADVSQQALEDAAKTLHAENISGRPEQVTPKADIVFIATPDGAIGDTCRGIVDNAGFGKGTVVIHFSGALPSTVLSPAKSLGAFIGSMHPLQSVASKNVTNAFQGVTFSIEGDEAARGVMKGIIDDLGATHILIETQSKCLYHAAAAIACNYLVTLEDAAIELMEEAGIGRENAFKVMGPLIRATLKNIESIGTEQALTGPIARGDVETVKRHVEEIEARKPKWLSLYKLLGLHTLDIATAGDTVSERDAETLRKILT
jgi:predicted short-subunit dehydrogenase-like oxidoreductase (DUF2520 family)